MGRFLMSRMLTIRHACCSKICINSHLHFLSKQKVQVQKKIWHTTSSQCKDTLTTTKSQELFILYYWKAKFDQRNYTSQKPFQNIVVKYVTLHQNKENESSSYYICRNDS